MSRELKFRVWDNVDYMSTPFTLNDLQLKIIRFTPECKVMQFTGLKDKNDIEIYEGDIVKCGTDKDAMEAVVVFKEASFLCQYLPIEKKEKENVYDLLSDYFHYKILGNRYEHPHLLKK